MIQKHSPPYFFIHVNKILIRITILIKPVVILTIRRISEPTEAQKYFTWYIVIHMANVINIKGKGISFIKQLGCKLSMIDFS